jgi:hypothetical protein
MMSRAFRVATFSSFLLCALVSLIWIRSLWRMDQFNSLRRAGQQISHLSACSACGHLMIGRIWTDDEILRGARVKPGFSSIPLTTEVDLVDGVAIAREGAQGIRSYKILLSLAFADFAVLVTRKAGSDDWLIVVPYWSLIFVTAVLPTLSLYRVRKARRRAAKGLCRRCGYDLRASTGRCPECGTAIPSSTEVAPAASPHE